MGELPETFVPGFHDEKAVRKMKYNLLGKTGLKVSQLSLGAGGFSYFYGKYDIEECKKTVHAAIKNGINLIDTAPWYGHGTSEEILGECLEGIPRKAYYLATKTCRYEKDPQMMFDFSAKKTLESIDVSLRRLKLNYVDILQIHDIEFAPNLEMVLNETLPTVQQIIKSGKARFIGITGYPVTTLAECLGKSKVKIDTVLSYCRLTMIENALKEYLPKFKSHNVGIINAAANSMGLLSNYGPPEWHPASEEVKNICTEARDYCKLHDVELGKLAIYHSLIQDGPDTTLVGMNNRTLLGINLDVVYNGLSDKETEVYNEVKKILGKLNETHWENKELKNYWAVIKGEKKSSGKTFV